VSRDAPPEPRDAPDSPSEPPEGTGRLRTTGPGPVTVLALVGMVLGWLVRPVSIWLDLTPPRVGWLPVLALLLAAAIVAAVAWATYRSVHRRHEVLPPHQAVNRLVLAKACALAGAFVGGGYLGYALSWVGARAELAGERLAHSGLAGAAGLVLMGAGLLLERACKVRPDDPPRDLSPR
jgi:hypothetical protein